MTESTEQKGSLKRANSDEGNSGSAGPGESLEVAKAAAEQFLSDHPDISMIEALLPDCNGVLRGKWLPRNKLVKVFSGALKMPKSALGLDIWGRDVPELAFTHGDADGLCAPISGSLMPAPWSPGGRFGQVMLTMVNPDNSPYLGDAQQVLKHIVARYHARGWRPVVAAELEFSLVTWDGPRPTHSGERLHHSEPIGGNTYGMDSLQNNHALFEQIHHACDVQGLPFDGVVTESAPSQYEVNMRHVDDPVLAARQILMLKRIIKEIARQHELFASFMPKPFKDEAGNGMHMHCSIIDAEGNNIFNDGTDEGSTELRSAVAGCVTHMADSFAIFAPSFNAYRRFQSESHAPTTPSWGYENRTVAVRVPAGDERARRLEHRVAGADANPNLLFAIILAAALDGIENQMQPPAASTGDAYKADADDERLPLSMAEALQRFRSSSFARDALGPELQKMFALTKEQELEQFQREITDLEYHAYLERA